MPGSISPPLSAFTPIFPPVSSPPRCLPADSPFRGSSPRSLPLIPLPTPKLSAGHVVCLWIWLQSGAHRPRATRPTSFCPSSRKASATSRAVWRLASRRWTARRSRRACCTSRAGATFAHSRWEALLTLFAGQPRLVHACAGKLAFVAWKFVLVGCCDLNARLAN